MRIVALTLLLLGLSGCSLFANRAPDVGEPLYRDIPEGLLQECELPPLPDNTGEMSEAFVQAYQCGEQGNIDKRRIRELQNQP